MENDKEKMPPYPDYGSGSYIDPNEVPNFTSTKDSGVTGATYVFTDSIVENKYSQNKEIDKLYHTASSMLRSMSIVVNTYVLLIVAHLLLTFNLVFAFYIICLIRRH